MITAINFTATEGRDESPLACEVRAALVRVEAVLARLERAQLDFGEAHKVAQAAGIEAHRAVRHFNCCRADWLASAPEGLN